MSYIGCNFCGGGLPGRPCTCTNFHRGFIDLPPQATGWTCPKCGRVHSPATKECGPCNAHIKAG